MKLPMPVGSTMPLIQPIGGGVGVDPTRPHGLTRLVSTHGGGLSPVVHGFGICTMPFFLSVSGLLLATKSVSMKPTSWRLIGPGLCVAGELERRWNETLQAVAKIEGDIAAMIARRPPPLAEPERQQLIALGADLERAWSHPAATAATRKRIPISEVIVRRDGAIIHAVLHWQGGDHTELQVKQRLNAAGRHNPRIPDDMMALIRQLARLMPDRQIARLLNRIGVAPTNLQSQ
jgi:hypothetical protein